MKDRQRSSARWQNDLRKRLRNGTLNAPAYLCQRLGDWPAINGRNMDSNNSTTHQFLPRHGEEKRSSERTEVGGRITDFASSALFFTISAGFFRPSRLKSVSSSEKLLTAKAAEENPQRSQRRATAWVHRRSRGGLVVMARLNIGALPCLRVACSSLSNIPRSARGSLGLEESA
jgi:hypothetical protein